MRAEFLRERGRERERERDRDRDRDRDKIIESERHCLYPFLLKHKMI